MSRHLTRTCVGFPLDADADFLPFVAVGNQVIDYFHLPVKVMAASATL
jgi:hypothetical protein